MDMARREGITNKTAILAGLLILNDAEEAETLREKHTDFVIPDAIIERMKNAGDQEAQKKEGLAIASEIIKDIKNIEGVRGIHILSGGKETAVPELLSASEL